jgi:1,2-phenylacetyl-CoA epoxidase catalytic subunit
MISEEGIQLNSKEFVAGLLEEMNLLFARLGETDTLESESEGNVDVVTLLRLALKSELEASELAGLWLPTTPEVDAKMCLAQQCGDEMKHYGLISQRLTELGEDLSGFDALADGHSPLYQYLRGLRTTVERIAAGPFTSEAIATVRNTQFVAFCRSSGDEGTARLYSEVIQPEEMHHHELGRHVLEKYATTPQLQELAAAAVRNTLAIADELRNLAAKTTGVHNIPVS